MDGKIFKQFYPLYESLKKFQVCQYYIESSLIKNIIVYVINIISMMGTFGGAKYPKIFSVLLGTLLLVSVAVKGRSEYVDGNEFKKIINQLVPPSILNDSFLSKESNFYYVVFGVSALISFLLCFYKLTRSILLSFTILASSFCSFNDLFKDGDVAINFVYLFVLGILILYFINLPALAAVNSWIWSGIFCFSLELLGIFRRNITYVLLNGNVDEMMIFQYTFIAGFLMQLAIILRKKSH